MIYKIVPDRLWHAAVAKGSFSGSAVDAQDGFIHFSTAAQVRETATKHFAGVADLVIVAVSTADLGTQLRWEPSRGGDLFPHLYADLPMTAVIWVRELPSDERGGPLFRRSSEQGGRSDAWFQHESGAFRSISGRGQIRGILRLVRFVSLPASIQRRRP